MYSFYVEWTTRSGLPGSQNPGIFALMRPELGVPVRVLRDALEPLSPAIPTGCSP